jgi:hypothetical protein
MVGIEREVLTRVLRRNVEEIIRKYGCTILYPPTDGNAMQAAMSESNRQMGWSARNLAPRLEYRSEAGGGHAGSFSNRNSNGCSLEVAFHGVGNRYIEIGV